MNHPRKDLLNISSLTDEEIHTLLDLSLIHIDAADEL